MVSFTKLKLSKTLLDTLQERFIAFDTETTGLDSYYDKIIEVGAVYFEHGQAVRQYGSLIHAVDYVPYEAQAVNHITNTMVRKAPPPAQVYKELVEFLGDAMQGDTLIVGHNATFDMKFLANALQREGVSADFLYADTCALSRIAMPNMYSHTQDAVAYRLGVVNRQSHRAVTDANTCGEIMVKMLPMLASHEKVLDEEAKRAAKRQKCEPCEEEKKLCTGFCAKYPDADMCYQKAGKLVHIRTSAPLLSMNVTGRKPYLVVSRTLIAEEDPWTLLPATAGEAKMYDDAVRVHVEGEITEAAEMLLNRALMREKPYQDAKTRWDVRREREIYWKA